MEDPASWKRAENVILEAYNDWIKVTDAGVTGVSMPAYVATALRLADVVHDADEVPVGASFVK